jgi:hypothetical protein
MKSFFLLILSVNILTNAIAQSGLPGTWNQNTAYASGSLVISNGSTYLAQQAVPSGTALTSTAYWQSLDSAVPTSTPGTAPTSTPDVTTAPTSTPASDSNTTTVIDTNSSRIKNISVRGYVGTGADVLIGGFVITGDKPKKVLVRALGPSLANFGVTGALENPFVYVVNTATGQQVAVNTSWETPISTESVDSIKNDPIFKPGDPKDAAMILTLDPGQYTATVADEGGKTGVALIEVNEFDQEYSTKIINISTRGYVGTGADVLIGGFVITGDKPKKVLVRALGPSLANFGVTGVLENPFVYVVNTATGQQVAVNTSWGSPISTESVDSISNNAIFKPGDTKDAAMIITLDPGEYTATVADEGGKTGVALIEVNEFE